jgi:hypothetical protein
MGTFSNQLRGLLHDVQCDAGHITDVPCGSRQMMTFRKLPMISPKQASTAATTPLLNAAAR